MTLQKWGPYPKLRLGVLRDLGHGASRFRKRTMVAKNGIGVNPSSCLLKSTCGYGPKSKPQGPQVLVLGSIYQGPNMDTHF